MGYSAISAYNPVSIILITTISGTVARMGGGIPCTQHDPRVGVGHQMVSVVIPNMVTRIRGRIPDGDDMRAGPSCIAGASQGDERRGSR